MHIAAAEVSQWVGFTTMLGMTVFAWWYRGSTVGLAYLFFNTIGNLYPCLLQQYNKGGLYRLIDALEKRNASNCLASHSLNSEFTDNATVDNCGNAPS